MVRVPVAVLRGRREGAFEELCSWIDFFDGFVHPKLDLAVTPLGIRGVVATEVLTEGDQAEMPCMVIPDLISITADRAANTLDDKLRVLGFPSVRKAPPELQVAMLLAYEKKLGSNSRFHPYIMTMPSVPPCGWMMSQSDAEHALRGIVAGPDISKWLTVVGQARAMYEDDLQDCEDFIDALALDMDDVRWALGQAVSRSYGNNPRLIPALDCVNHSANCTGVLAMKGENGSTMTAVGNFDSNWHIRELDAGDELLVNYKLGSETSPVEMFIDYGFVPAEMLEEGGMAPTLAFDDEDFDHDELEGY